MRKCLDAALAAATHLEARLGRQLHVCHLETPAAVAVGQRPQHARARPIEHDDRLVRRSCVRLELEHGEVLNRSGRLEVDLQGAAHGRTVSIGADDVGRIQVAGAFDGPFTCGDGVAAGRPSPVLDATADPVAVDVKRTQAAVPLHGQVALVQLALQQRLELVLSDGENEGPLVVEAGQVDAEARLVAVVEPHRADVLARRQHLAAIGFGQQPQRACVEAQRVAVGADAPFAVDQSDGDAGTAQPQGREHADRPAPDDQHRCLAIIVHAMGPPDLVQLTAAYRKGPWAGNAPSRDPGRPRPCPTASRPQSADSRAAVMGPVCWGSALNHPLCTDDRVHGNRRSGKDRAGFACASSCPVCLGPACIVGPKSAGNGRSGQP